MRTITKVHWMFGDYTKEDLMQMDPVPLGGLFRERTHHNVEVPLYPTLLKWNAKPIDGFGQQAQIVFDAWKERGLPENTPDIQWASQNLAIAAKIRAGERVSIDETLPVPFTDEEMSVVNKLIYTRRSIRDWLDKEVPDEMLEKILEAGRAAPIGCNMGHIRFIVLKDPEEKKMIWSDISTVNAVIIVICHDNRIPAVVGQDQFVPQNPGFDAAAAGDHMLLMAHALGLGACWLSSAKATSKTKDTAKMFKERYGLPEYIEVHLHIAVGWTAIASIKSARPALKDLIIRRETK